MTKHRLAHALAGLTLAGSLLLAGCAVGAPPPDESGQPPSFPPPSAPASLSPDDGGGTDVDVTVIAANLPQPWGIAFLPDGSGLVTERKTGQIVRLGQPETNDGLTATPFTTVTGVVATGDGGLLGIAVSPHYATDNAVFVYYSTATDNRIVELRTGQPPLVILKGIPHGATDNGGALAFGPDGYLYASTGDAGNVVGGSKAPSQSATSLAGKILRMTAAGKPAPGNQVATSLVYASGFHNVEGLAWDTKKFLYVVDAGAHADNLDVVKAGSNYGWPISGTASAPANAPDPIQTWPPADSTCSGIATVGDAVATACPTGKRMWLTQITANATALGAPAAVLTDKYGRLRSVVSAPDQSLWVSTSNTDGHGTPGPNDDQILRIVLADEGAGVT